MKYFIGLCMALGTLFCQAQDSNTTQGIQKKIQELYRSRNSRSGPAINLPAITLENSLFNADSLIFKIRSQNDSRRAERVKYLKQDNMPCVVPDTKDIAAIPNAAGIVINPFPTTIPNPAEKSPSKK